MIIYNKPVRFLRVRHILRMDHPESLRRRRVSQVVVDVERTRVGIIHGREDEARLRSTGGSAVNVNVGKVERGKVMESRGKDSGSWSRLIDQALLCNQAPYLFDY